MSANLKIEELQPRVKAGFYRKSNFAPNEHYSRKVEIKTKYGDEACLSASHWDTPEDDENSRLASVFRIDTGCAIVSIHTGSDDIRAIAAMLLDHADELDMHAAELSKTAVAA